MHLGTQQMDFSYKIGNYGLETTKKEGSGCIGQLYESFELPMQDSCEED